MNSQVVKLKSKEELTQYARVSQYSFFDTTGWSERFLLSDSFKGDVYACSEQGRVMSGIVSHNLSFTYWGERGIASSGIGCVASDPIVRNKGHIRDILNHLLKENYQNGKILSFLYPFSYKYYGMFGYGTMGNCAEYKFNPEEINKTPAPDGEYTLFDDSEEQYGEYVTLLDSWAAQFHGGVSTTQPIYPLKEFLEDMKRDRLFLYFYRDEKGKALSCLLYKMQEGKRSQAIKILKSAWLDGSSFRALTHFLWRHRSQVGEIFWTLPLSVPLEQMTREPRIHREVVQMWMGRPVNVLKALKIKSGYTPVKEPFAFTLEDPSIPENCGTYRLQGCDVVQEAVDPSVAVLDFSVFSAMIMGGLSLAEAKISGRVSEDFSADPAYLSRLENICITEGF